MSRICGVLCSLVTIISGIGATNPRGIHSNLTEKLLSNYGPTSPRPVSDVEKRIDVEIDLEVIRVIELNWHDEYLTWNTTEYPNVTVLIIPTDQIWRPDIHLYENVDRNFESLKDVGAWVHPDGAVEWATPAILYTSCRIDARLFPFDTQHCTLRFGSWSYDIDQLNLQPKIQTNGGGNYFIENGVWHLGDVLVESVVNKYVEGEFPEVVYTVILHRRPLFHVFGFILPCTLLSLLNLLAFILPTESGEKVSLGITNLLALVLFQQLIGDSLPPSSSNMPIISYYFTPMILIGCLSIVDGVLVAALYHQDRTTPVPTWLRKLTRVHTLTNTIHVKDDMKQLTDIKENDFRNTSLAINGHDISPIAYPAHNTQEGGEVVAENPLHSRLDNTSDWRQVASVIDRLMVALAVILTITAVVVTAVLFATSSD